MAWCGAEGDTRAIAEGQKQRAGVFVSAAWAWRGEPAPNDRAAFKTTPDTPQKRLGPAREVPAKPTSVWSSWRCAMQTGRVPAQLQIER